MHSNSEKRPITLRQQRGFTLLELAIVVVVVMVIVGTALVFISTGQEMVRQEVLHAELEQRAMLALSRIAEDARRTGASQLIPSDPDGEVGQLSFLPVVDLDAEGNPVYAAAAVTYLVLPAEGEIPGNQLDDDDNGLIDDQILQRTTAEQAEAGLGGTIILTGLKGWDEDAGEESSGLRARRVTGSARLRLEITLQARDDDGRLVERTCRTSVTMRNQ